MIITVLRAQPLAMNRFRSFAALCAALLPYLGHAQGQVQGRVLDAHTREPLAFVHLLPVGAREGATTDIDGRFQLMVTTAEVMVRATYVGYKPLEQRVSAGEVVELLLQRAAVELAQVEILPGENPAHRIIQRAYANRVANDGLFNRPHRYTSYSKTLFTGDVDSTLLRDPARIAALDTSDREAVEFMQRQHIFLIESATRRTFLPPAASKEEVLAMRVSGIQDPSLLAAMASTQTFSIYAPQIVLGERTYVGPIGPGSTAKYLFLLQDTLLQGNDSVFVISYAPRRGRKFEALKGLLYIHTDGYAVQNVIAEPVVRDEGVSMKLQQQFARVPGGAWFPEQLNTFLFFDGVKVNDWKLVGISRTYLKEIELDAEVTRREVRGPELVMERTALRRDTAFWSGLRTDTLDAKERLTYQVIDSIGEAEGLDRKLRLLGYLASGRVPLGLVDLRLDQVLRYNGYEGLRLGLGAVTNDMVSRHVALGGYFAYGFTDKAWKYGGDLSISPWATHGPALKLTYALDVDESGGVSFPGRRLAISSESYRWLFVDRMDQVERFGAEISFRSGSAVRWWLGTERTDRRNLMGYQYAEPVGKGLVALQDRFLTGAVQATVRIAPREQVVRTPLGEQVLPSRWPVLQVQGYRAMQGLWEGELATWRVNAMVDKTFRTRMWGALGVRLMAGISDDTAPYPFLFNVRGSNVQRAPLATQNTFETMLPNEFLADRYVAIHLRHSFGHLLFQWKDFKPVPVLVFNSTVAGLSAPERHRGYSFATVDEAYFEAGLQVDQLLVSGFTSLGVGAFHRFGPNQLPELKDNFAYKVSLGFAF